MASITAELNAALKPYGLDLDDLPAIVRDGIVAREAFTLVEGVAPTAVYKQRILADDWCGDSSATTRRLS